MHNAMSEHENEDGRHQPESELLRAQEHKGYGDDEGEREELLEAEEEDESPSS
jgi:hypothetical protein